MEPNRIHTGDCLRDNELRKMRTRWLRWLGQKTRHDKPYWVTLLDSNWIGWAYTVADNNPDTQWPDGGSVNLNRDYVKKFYEKAISLADMKMLMRLDNLYTQEKVERL